MNEDKRGARTGGKDRKLGDEWIDWNGETSPEENQVDEKPATFLGLAGASALILLACLCFAWYLTKPRFDQTSSLLSNLIQLSALVLGAVALVACLIEATLLMRFGTSVLPYRWTEKVLLYLLSKSMWLGNRLGINKDRVASSFIKAHNRLLKSHARELKTDSLLILLPRCLQKEAKQQVTELVDGRAVEIVTVGGGEEARKVVRQHKPSLILAVACERDLISGIRDLAERVHVLAIPNKRPEGPCKNTYLQLDAFDEALRFIAGRTGKAVKS